MTLYELSPQFDTTLPSYHIPPQQTPSDPQANFSTLFVFVCIMPWFWSTLLFSVFDTFLQILPQYLGQMRPSMIPIQNFCGHSMLETLRP